jgi:hypothetical protein
MEVVMLGPRPERDDVAERPREIYEGFGVNITIFDDKMASEIAP